MFLKGIWRRAVGLLAVCGAVLAVSVGPAARGEELTMEEMRQRLEKLEKLNEQLLKRLDGGAPAAPDADGSLPVLQGADGAVDAEAVKKIVSDYLKATDAKKKKDEDEKKKIAESTFTEVGKDLSLKTRWDYGLWAETADKAFRVHVGGRAQWDPVWMHAPDNVQFGAAGTGPVQDAVNFRRARLAVEGTMYEVIDFNTEYDFLNQANVDPLVAANPGNVINVPVPTDLWVTFTHLPYIGNIRVGNQKPPISLEHLTSSRWLNFMERSFAFDAFIGGLDNGFRPGVHAFNTFADERATWAIGLFKNQSQIFGWNVGDGEMDVTGRLTWLPWYEHEGRCLLHLGLGASHRDADDDQLRYRARTLLRNGPPPLQTVVTEARMFASGETLVVPEFSLQVGPLLINAEYFGVWAHNVVFPRTPVAAQRPRGTPYFYSYYVEALYFLTGENRDYNRRPRERVRQATWNRVIPYENFFLVRNDNGDGCCCGRGAWQVGARYSYINLEDNGVFGGRADDITLGLNWFINPNMKLQWNYIYEWRDLPVGTSNGDIQGFGMRLAVDF